MYFALWQGLATLPDAQPDPTTILTGILSSATLGWSVWRMIWSSINPEGVPGGTVTVSAVAALEGWRLVGLDRDFNVLGLVDDVEIG